MLKTYIKVKQKSKNITGIHSNYDVPENPNLKLIPLSMILKIQYLKSGFIKP